MNRCLSLPCQRMPVKIQWPPCNFRLNFQLVTGHEITFEFAPVRKSHWHSVILILTTKERGRRSCRSMRQGKTLYCALQCHMGAQANLVSRAFKGLFLGCCSKQLTAGLPATGTVIALSTREVMACTARTWIWVLSVSSWKERHTLATRKWDTDHQICLHFMQCS
jgi:hypothetical protein